MDFSLPPFRLRVFRQTLYFKQPACTSRGVYTERRVWYIAVRSATSEVNFLGIGECAPLYDLSADYDEDYDQRLRELCHEVEQMGKLDSERYRALPSMLFGLQTAFLSARASIRGDGRLLFPSDFTEGRKSIPINGLVWMGRQEEMAERLEEKLRDGFNCIKLKIGAIGFDRELPLIESIRARYSKEIVTIRVDANGGFSPEEAPFVLKELARLDVHSIEQPLRAGLRAEIAELCRTSPVPIALDEELIGLNETKEKAKMLDTIRPAYIVIKPTLHGALTGAEEWISLARERGIVYWITSALESNIGLNAIAQWTAVTDTQDSLHQGLGTGRLFVRNCNLFPLTIKGERLYYGEARQAEFLDELHAFLSEWHNERPTLTVQTSGSTGRPQQMEVEKRKMQASAEMTLSALHIPAGSTALLAMPLRYIAGKMMVVRSLVGRLRLIPVAPTARPFANLATAPYFAALTPMQVYETLRVPREARLLRRVRCLIIGGGAVSEELSQRLHTFPHAVYSTYGMTETLSHIALRRLSGKKADTYYHPLPDVRVCLDETGVLVIDAPRVHNGKLVTNDLAQIQSDGGFVILGRKDNVISSGGIKLQLEKIEAALSSLSFSFNLTSVADERLGQALTMIYEGEERDATVLKAACRSLVSPYETPRYFLCVKSLPKTETGKPARASLQRLAEEIICTDSYSTE